MNKTSIQLYPKSRKPLYRHKNINEKLLNKELNFFYSYCQKERRDNNKSFLSKSQGNFNYLKEDKDEKNNSENKYRIKERKKKERKT